MGYRAKRSKGRTGNRPAPRTDAKNGRPRVTPGTPNQSAYIKAIRSSTITICDGPAGCGKTFLAVDQAVQALAEGKCDKIIMVRPIVEAGEHLGFLPGNVQTKVLPYMRPLYDALYKLCDFDEFRRLTNSSSKLVEVMPLAYMRGCTFDHSFIMLDEAQNTTPEQMVMFLTRMGQESQVVIAGDTTQNDLEDSSYSGLELALDRFGHRLSREGFKNGSVSIVHMTDEDSNMRHGFMSEILATLHTDPGPAHSSNGYHKGLRDGDPSRFVI